MITFTKTANSVEMDLGTDVHYLPVSMAISAKVSSGKIHLSESPSSATNFITFVPTEVNGRPGDDILAVAEWLRDTYFTGLSLSGVGGGGGPIEDGASAAIKATVLDYTNSNPIAVRLTDTTGDYITAGGGAQYTEGDVDATITGTVLMMEGAGNTIVAAPGTAADGLLVNLGINNDVRLTDGTNVADVVPLGTAVVTADNGIVTNTVIHGLNSGGGGAYVDVKVNPSGALVTATTLEASTANIGDVDVLTLPAVTNGGTFAVQESGAALTSLQLIDDTVYTDGVGTVTKGIAILGQDGTNPQAIKTDASGELQVDVLTLPNVVVGSGTVTTVSTVTSLTQMNGQAISMGTGVRDAGTQRVTIATNDAVPITDNAGSLTVDNAGTFAVQATLAAETTKVIGTVNQGTSPWVTSNATTSVVGNGAAATAQRVTLANDSTGVIASVTSLTQMNGQAIAMGTGARSAGTQRVTIATDDVVPSSQSGTWTVQPGNTANTTAWLVNDQPVVSGGLSKFHLVSAATTNATNIKASAGQVYSITAFNLNAAARYLKFHNTAGTPTAGVAVTDAYMIPGNTAGAGLVLNIDKGIAFSTGIGITLVTGIADANASAVAADEILLNIYYK